MRIKPMRLHPRVLCDVDAALVSRVGSIDSLTMQQDLIAQYMRTLQVGYELFRA